MQSFGILRDRENRERTVENILRVFERNDPQGAKLFVDHVKEVRTNLRPGGMSEGGHFALNMLIPDKVFDLMCYCFGPEWRNDDETKRAFARVAGAFHINPQSITKSIPEKLDDRDKVWKLTW